MKNAVLFVVGKNYISRRIQTYTQQDGIEKKKTASHVAYKFWYDPAVQTHKNMLNAQKTGWYVIESHFDSGVIVYEYDCWLKLNRMNDYFEVVDNSYNIDLMLNLIGENYGIKDVLKIKLQTDLMFLNKNLLLKIIGIPAVLAFKVIQSLITKDNTGIYCSELLLKANDIITKAIGKKPFESFPSDLQKYYLDKEKEVVA
jgi:hypothetical protein